MRLVANHLRRAFGCFSNLIVSLSAGLFQRSLDCFFIHTVEQYPSFTHKISYLFYLKKKKYVLNVSIYTCICLIWNRCIYDMYIHIQYMSLLKVIWGIWALWKKTKTCIYTIIYIHMLDYIYIYIYDIILNIDIYIYIYIIYVHHTCTYSVSPRPWCCFAPTTRPFGAFVQPATSGDQQRGGYLPARTAAPGLGAMEEVSQGPALGSRRGFRLIKVCNLLWSVGIYPMWILWDIMGCN